MKPDRSDSAASGRPFVLEHEVLAAEGATRTALVVHGALGSGQNFRGFVRKLALARPEYAFVLVDLRSHGRSRGAPPPHTMSSAATDLAVLAERLSETHAALPPVTTLIGHSLGGKVTLTAAREHPGLATQVFVLDSDPGTRDPASAHEIHTVIRGVRSISMPVTSRKEVVDALRNQGFSSGLASWMTTNLQRIGEVLDWSFDLNAIEALLSDYFRQDLWPCVESPPSGVVVELVIAENSDRWSDEMRARAARIDPRTGTRVHHIPNAGHWLHVDNPDALRDLLTATLQ